MKSGLFENFIVSEIEKLRKNTHAKETLYFYREYSGQEVDVVLEDYQKHYVCIEIKLQSRKSLKDIFPLPHTFITINMDNYFEKIGELFDFSLTPT